MQVFPFAKHQIPDPRRAGDRRYQPSRHDKFYSPIHLRPDLIPRPLPSRPACACSIAEFSSAAAATWE